jgi:hypothetical protein
MGSPTMLVFEGRPPPRLGLGRLPMCQEQMGERLRMWPVPAVQSDAEEPSVAGPKHLSVPAHRSGPSAWSDPSVVSVPSASGPKHKWGLASPSGTSALSVTTVV